MHHTSISRLFYYIYYIVAVKYTHFLRGRYVLFKINLRGVISFFISMTSGSKLLFGIADDSALNIRRQD